MRGLDLVVSHKWPKTPNETKRLGQDSVSAHASALADPLTPGIRPGTLKKVTRWAVATVLATAVAANACKSDLGPLW